MVMRRLGEAEKGVCERHHAAGFWWRSRAHGENPDWFEIQKIGAANRIRTCDPVITNDVLYQLSYCGGPSGAFSKGRKRLHLISGSARLGKKNASAAASRITRPIGTENHA